MNGLDSYRLDDAPWLGRYGAGAVALCKAGATQVDDCSLVVLGGRNASTCHDDLWVGRITVDRTVPQPRFPVVTWELMQDDLSLRTGGIKRYESQAVTMRLPPPGYVQNGTKIPDGDLEDTLVYMGGHRCGEAGMTETIAFNDVWAVTRNGQWQPLGGDDCGVAVPGNRLSGGCAPWTPRHGFASVVAADPESPTGQRLYMMGGVRYLRLGEPTPTFLNDVWRTTNGVDWEQVTSSARWSQRGFSGLQVLGNAEQNALFLFGGKRTTGDSCSDENHPNDELCRSDVWASQDRGLTWQEIDSDESSPWIGRTSFSVVPVRTNWEESYPSQVPLFNHGYTELFRF
jgi:hypothetical protein